MSEYKNLSSMNIRRLQRDQPCIAEFIDSIGLTRAVKATSVKEWINSLSDEDLADGGMARDMLLPHMQQLLHEVDSIYQTNQTQIETLTIIGGCNKKGEPENIELKIMLPVSEAIFLEENAQIKAFFDNDPTNSWLGKIKYISYKPELTEQNILSYKIIANFDDIKENGYIPSIGLRGTAKIYSKKVTLFFYLFRKPITATRQWIGW